MKKRNYLILANLNILKLCQFPNVSKSKMQVAEG